jgi:sarcosine oxidase gamma subunit
MMRVRLKADGRIVEILPDGREQALSTRLEAILAQAAPHPAADGQAATAASGPSDAAYARGVRSLT